METFLSSISKGWPPLTVGEVGAAVHHHVLFQGSDRAVNLDADFPCLHAGFPRRCPEEVFLPCVLELDRFTGLLRQGNTDRLYSKAGILAKTAAQVWIDPSDHPCRHIKQLSQFAPVREEMLAR